MINTDADLLRDLALEHESIDFKKAKRLMELALLARPTGPFIIRKVEEYQKIELDNKTITDLEIRVLNGKIFYQHIAKAGGTSINNYFSNIYSSGKVQTHIESLDITKEIDRLKNLQFISGHKRYFHVDRIIDLKNHYCLTMIRNPLDHLVSHLKWVLKVSENTESNFYKNHPEPIRELSLHMRSINWHTYDDVKGFFKYEYKAGLYLFNNCQTRYFLSNQSGYIQGKDFKEAEGRMKSFNLIGKLEYKDLFMKELSSDIDKPYKKLDKLNINKSKAFIDLENPSILNLLLEQIQYDIKLYNSFDKIYRGTTT